MKKTISFLIITVLIFNGLNAQSSRAWPEQIATVNPPHYNINSFTDSSNFSTSFGPTLSGGKIVATNQGDGGGFQKWISFKDTVCSNHWRIAFRFRNTSAKGANTFGASVGIRSVNTTARYSMSAFANTSNSGTTGRRELFKEANSGAWASLLTSSTTVANAQNDWLVVTMERNNQKLTITVWNSTTNVASDRDPITLSTTDGNSVLPNTGVPTMWIHSSTGGVEIDSFFFQDLSVKYADIAFIADSKGTAFDASTFAASWTSLVASKYPSFEVFAGHADKTAEIKARLTQIIAAKPKVAICAFGSNDIRNGISSATWQANYKYIDSALTVNGIYVLHCLPFKEASLDQSALTSFLQTDAQFTGRIINTDVVTQRAGLLSGDNIHLNDAGNLIVSDQVIYAPQLINRVRYQNPNQ